jgi:hypothetical protein
LSSDPAQQPARRRGGVQALSEHDQVDVAAFRARRPYSLAVSAGRLAQLDQRRCWTRAARPCHALEEPPWSKR